MNSITVVQSSGPIEPNMQPYTAARPGDGLYVLLQPLQVWLPEDRCVVLEKKHLWRGKEEFVFDGTSIPQLVWSAVGIRLGGRCRLAGTIHDFFYQTNGWVSFLGQPLSRKECDEIFRDHLLRAGVAPFKCWVAYRAVRACGWSTWNKHAKRIAAEA